VCCELFSICARAAWVLGPSMRFRFSASGFLRRLRFYLPPILSSPRAAVRFPSVAAARLALVQTVSSSDLRFSFRSWPRALVFAQSHRSAPTLIFPSVSQLGSVPRFGFGATAREFLRCVSLPRFNFFPAAEPRIGFLRDVFFGSLVSALSCFGNSPDPPARAGTRWIPFQRQERAHQLGLRSDFARCLRSFFPPAS
jgi:hypothetical protein